VSTVLIERLKAEDPAVRVAAAAGLGELKPPGGAAALAAAYEAGQRDLTYSSTARPLRSRCCEARWRTRIGRSASARRRF
jgi:hypothetical protein